jgi:transposase
MRILQLKPYLSDHALKNKMQEMRSDLSYPKWQVLYLIQVGMQTSASVIAPLVNLSVHSVYKIVEGYNLKGESFIQTKARGGRRRSLMTIEMENKVMKGLEADALKGKIKSGVEIKERVKKIAKKEVSDDFIWDLLKRHGWSKKKLRPEHPKGDKNVRDEFKKNSRSYWLPASVN